MPSDKTGEKRDIMVIIQILKLEKDKTATMLVFFKLNQRIKKHAREVWGVELHIGFLERSSDFSLKYRAIRQSKFFGTRRKVALREEAYAWAPALGSFVKL